MSFSRIQTEVIISSWKIGNGKKTWTRAAVPGLDVLKTRFYLGEKVPWISLLLIIQHLLVKHCRAPNFNLRKWTLWSFPYKSVSTHTEERRLKPQHSDLWREDTVRVRQTVRRLSKLTRLYFIHKYEARNLIWIINR